MTSKFYIEDVDLEYFLDEFNDIADHLDDPPWASEKYLIEGVSYYSILTFSDKKCVAINDNKSVFLINKISGQVKLLAKRPQDFVKGYLNGEFALFKQYYE
jgi:hypothetical protein